MGARLNQTVRHAEALAAQHQAEPADSVEKVAQLMRLEAQAVCLAQTAMLMGEPEELAKAAQAAQSWAAALLVAARQADLLAALQAQVLPLPALRPLETIVHRVALRTEAVRLSRRKR